MRPCNERVTDDRRFDGAVRARHHYRYCVAAQYLTEGDVVVDAACGSGYSRHLLPHEQWIGLDKIADPPIDLETYRPDFPYDAWLSFETIEHLHDPSVLISNAHKATRLCAFSVPIYAGAEDEEHHVRKWTTTDLDLAIRHPEWHTIRWELQEGRYALAIQLRRTTHPSAFFRGSR